ncbi:MAG: hypothetical protein KGS48_05705 [Bacteroidetes bacterium]|nr:hypothetical protein [Bacteroidota bacterium]
MQLKTICLLAFWAGSLGASLHAQQSTHVRHYHPIQVGFGPISALTRLGKFNVCAEWVYKPKQSISLLVSVPINHVPAILGWGDIHTRDLSSKHNLTVLNIVLENKHYFSPGTKDAFYFAPYARYLEYHVWKRDSAGTTQANYLYSNKVKGFGLGGALGVQISLGHRFILDFTFLGVDLKLVRGYQRYETDYSEPDYGEVLLSSAKHYWTDVPIYRFRVKHSEVSSNMVRTRTNLQLVPGYRANLTIKYCFGKSVPLAVN